MYHHEEIVIDGMSYVFTQLDGVLINISLSDPLEPYHPDRPERNLLQ